MNDRGNGPVYVAGLGCRRGCPASALLAVLQEGLARAGVPLAALTALASVAHKRDEPGLWQLARQLERPLVFFPPPALQVWQSQLTRHSARVQQITGVPGVAEAAALALAARLAGAVPGLRLGKYSHAAASMALAEAWPEEAA